MVRPQPWAVICPCSHTFTASAGQSRCSAARAAMRRFVSERRTRGPTVTAITNASSEAPMTTQ